jgi:hypothetical protein
MKGAAGDAIHFHGDDSERYPDDQACRLQTYVIPRDEVMQLVEPRNGAETVG